ncbi:MAG: hypothetical protein KDA84_13200, partial [Planctomycetaceae bacterium]|nr:hypothetical protein [Planctomycetaceae bacterium]
NGGAGRVARYSEGKSVGSSTKLDIDHSYTNDADEFSAIYKSQAMIDRQGLRSSQGTYTLKEGGRSTIVTIAVRRLTGSDLETAQKSAIDELGNLPKSLLPVQFARKSLSLKLPESYSSASLPIRGKKVAYYDRDLNQYFEATYLGEYSRTEVQIQLTGSNERLTVRSSAISKIEN